jgi:hypothetical protein
MELLHTTSITEIAIYIEDEILEIIYEKYGYILPDSKHYSFIECKLRNYSELLANLFIQNTNIKREKRVNNTMRFYYTLKEINGFVKNSYAEFFFNIIKSIEEDIFIETENVQCKKRKPNLLRTD